MFIAPILRPLATLQIPMPPGVDAGGLLSTGAPAVVTPEY